MTVPAIARGDLGLRIDVPADWALLEDKELAAVWRTPAGALVLASLLPEAVVASEDALDDHRHDLRLVAAARGGGLVACMSDAALGVVGVTVEPRPDGLGLTAVGRAMVPVSGGHVSLSVVAHGDDAGEGPGADPYGFRYESVPPLPGTGIEHAAWPSGLRLARPTDLADPAPAGHPLGPVRAALATLRQVTSIVAPPPAPAPRQATIDGGVTFELPVGVLPAQQGRLKHGQLFRRVTFEKRVTFVTVCRHPEAREASKSGASARRLVEQHLAFARTQPTSGPHVEATVIGGKAGVIVEHEAVIGGAVGMVDGDLAAPAEAKPAAPEGKRGGGARPAGGSEERAPAGRATSTEHATYTISAFLPWDDHALEVTIMGERDDWVRLQRDLDRVVASVKSATRPALVPDTSRLTGEITAAGRRRIYRILCHLAHTDGVVGAEERVVLEAQREQLGVTTEEAAVLEAEGKAAQKLDVSKNASEQKLLLDAMLDVIAADGCLDHVEQRRLTEIATACGVPRAVIAERLLSRLSGP